MKRRSLPIPTIALAVFLIGAIGFWFWATQSRLSAAVALVFKGDEISSYLRKPGISFVETYFRFEKELGEDVIFGVDQEFVEGTDAPIYLKGGDWMSFVGLQRNGAVWVAEGSEETMKGLPSKDRSWKILKMKKPLQADIWYHMRCYADFGKREYMKVEIDGPGVSETFDLTGVTVDYPNYMPFDKSSMTYYVCAIRSRSLMKSRGVPRVYFDDVRGGIVLDGKETSLFSCDFENIPPIAKQPITLPSIRRDKYESGRFYLEREESKVRVEDVNFAHSGHRVCVADVDLDK